MIGALNCPRPNFQTIPLAEQMFFVFLVAGPYLQLPIWTLLDCQ